MMFKRAHQRWVGNERSHMQWWFKTPSAVSRPLLCFVEILHGSASIAP
jgi:hypothetical protein